MPVTIEGIPELMGRLESLANGKKVRAASRRGVLKAGRICAKAAKQRAPKGPTGNLKRAVRVGSVRTYPSGTVYVAVGAEAGKGGGAHAHLVEFGTAGRQWKSGKSTGQMPAHPFMRPAFDETKGSMQDVIAAELVAEIEKAGG